MNLRSVALRPILSRGLPLSFFLQGYFRKVFCLWTMGRSFPLQALAFLSSRRSQVPSAPIHSMFLTVVKNNTLLENSFLQKIL
jgi:hypothetical protein